jgi:hypothetical protein
VPCQPTLGPCALSPREVESRELARMLGLVAWIGFAVVESAGDAAGAPLRGAPWVSLAHPPTRCVGLSAAVFKIKVIGRGREPGPRRAVLTRRSSFSPPLVDGPRHRSKGRGCDPFLGTRTAFPLLTFRTAADRPTQRVGGWASETPGTPRSGATAARTASVPRT